jgi:hypothetical protein
MINSLRTISLTLMTIALLSSAAQAAPVDQKGDQIHAVLKHDGTVGLYRLRPVHFDPTHASVVNQRMAETVKTDANLPASYQIPKSIVPKVMDQGQRGSCAYFATNAILDAYYMRHSATNQNPNLSEECLLEVRNWMFDQGAKYTGTDKPGQRPDPDGDDPDSIIQTISNLGIPVAGKYGIVDCTYNDNKEGALAPAGYSAAVDASATSTGAYGKGFKFDQNYKPTIDEIRALIASNVPVEVGILVYNADFNTDDWRYNWVDDDDSNIAGGHAVTLTGYTTDDTGTHFTFKNSWGLDWGSYGFGTLSDTRLIHSWGYDPSFDNITSAHD